MNWQSPKARAHEEGREEMQRIVRRILTASTRLPSGAQRVRVGRGNPLPERRVG